MKTTPGMRLPWNSTFALNFTKPTRGPNMSTPCMVTSFTTSCGSIERVHSWNGLDASAFSTGTAGSDARTGTLAPFMVTEYGDAADDDDDDAMAAARVRAWRERRAAPLSMRERIIPVAPHKSQLLLFLVKITVRRPGDVGRGGAVLYSVLWMRSLVGGRDGAVEGE
jgi:hypothetical protein